MISLAAQLCPDTRPWKPCPRARWYLNQGRDEGEQGREGGPDLRSHPPEARGRVPTRHEICPRPPCHTSSLQNREGHTSVAYTPECGAQLRRAEPTRGPQTQNHVSGPT